MGWLVVVVAEVRVERGVRAVGVVGAGELWEARVGQNQFGEVEGGGSRNAMLCRRSRRGGWGWDLSM